ncbi:MAG: cupin domain-containing protein [Cyclobacteriaceae bacterium]|jgi:hypothetical protein|nr:cupin domain-containing protein [Cyclobacteriaceae bacterium]
MNAADYWIRELNLMPHPEGGFYRETYRAREVIAPRALPTRYAAARPFGTAIYFLLRSGDRSVFHRLKSDELWHFYEGTTILLYLLTEDGLQTKRVGRAVHLHESLQVVIPAGTWFAAEVEAANSFGLVGCTVSPGFDFADFEMASRHVLAPHATAHPELIERFTSG